MLVTLLVFQPLKSKDVRFLQSKNMPDMSVTLLVFQPLKSKDVKVPQFSANMPDMLVTLLVSK